MPSKYGFESEQERQLEHAQELQRIDPIVRDVLDDFISTLNWVRHDPVQFSNQYQCWWTRGDLPVGQTFTSWEQYQIWYVDADQATKPSLMVARTRSLLPSSLGMGGASHGLDYRTELTNLIRRYGASLERGPLYRGIFFG
jgi:hypothetical protein